jgi:hypothetical protein
MRGDRAVPCHRGCVLGERRKERFGLLPRYGMREHTNDSCGVRTHALADGRLKPAP